jgi:hypothetical protein
MDGKGMKGIGIYKLLPLISTGGGSRVRGKGGGELLVFPGGTSSRVIKRAPGRPGAGEVMLSLPGLPGARFVARGWGEAGRLINFQLNVS